MNAIWALPADSATKKSLRDGDWSEDQYIAARAANELMLLRADYAGANGERRNPNLLESPSEAEARQRELAMQHSLHDWMHDLMSGKRAMAPRQRGPMRIDEEKGGVA